MASLIWIDILQGLFSLGLERCSSLWVRARLVPMQYNLYFLSKVIVSMCGVPMKINVIGPY